MSEQAASKTKPPMDSATAILRRVNWAPGRYSDNIGIQFLLELQKLGDRDGGDGKQDINDFITRLSGAKDMYREPLTALEQEALANIADRFHLSQQLKDSTFASNARSTLMSRRTFIGAIGGGIVGTLAGQLLGGFSPANNPELARAQENQQAMGGRLGDLRRRDDELADLYDRPAAELSDTNVQRILDLSRDKRRYNREAAVAEADLRSSMSFYTNILGPISAAAPYAGPVLGAGYGIYQSTAGEVSEQANKKFEAAIETLDQLINYKLGRTAYTKQAGGVGR